MPDLFRLLRVLRIKWHRRTSRAKPYRKAPPIRHPERLHHSTRRAAVPVSPVNFDALRYLDRMRQVAGYQ